MPGPGSIEFAESAVEELVDYCGRNKFYDAPSVLRAVPVLYAGTRSHPADFTDVAEAQVRIMRTSAESNCAHYWNVHIRSSPSPSTGPAGCGPHLFGPRGTLDASVRASLCALRTSASGRCKEPMDLHASELLSRLEVLTAWPYPSSLHSGESRVPHSAECGEKTRYDGSSASFRDGPGETVRLPKPRSHRSECQAQEQSRQEETESRAASVGRLSFPVSDDDLLTIAQPLTYEGRQVDAAHPRTGLVAAGLRQSHRTGLHACLRRLAQTGHVVGRSRQTADPRSWK